MSEIKLRRLIHNMRGEYSEHATTRSTCPTCSEHLARSIRCAYCIEVEIADLVEDFALAAAFHEAEKARHRAVINLLDAINKE